MSRSTPAILSLAGLAACTWLSFRFGQGFAFTGFLDLILVVLTALYGGLWQATAISVLAAACLNYFFVPPIFSFVNSPANWVALCAFEFTALVISRLSLRSQVQAKEAIGRRREVERLYETSRRILLLDGGSDFGHHIVSLVREVFELESIQLFDALSATTYETGDCPPNGAKATRDSYFFDADRYDSGTRSWYCIIRLGARPVGSLSLHHTSMSKLAATALASLCGIAMERLRAQQRESRAEAARQTEQLRTAVLDALAHEFKTPLAIVRTASSGLLAVGGMSEFQTDLVASIDEQASSLDYLATRLLTAARLEEEEVKPKREPLLFSEVVQAAVQKAARCDSLPRFRLSVLKNEVRVLGDRELLLTSVVQVVQNAIQYSEPASPIDITFTLFDSSVVLRVLSKGVVVTPHQRERIFERFYRAPGAEALPAGTGLGLSIVKKIVEAHHGSVWAEGEQGYGTAVSISLPAA